MCNAISLTFYARLMLAFFLVGVLLSNNFLKLNCIIFFFYLPVCFVTLSSYAYSVSFHRIGFVHLFFSLSRERLYLWFSFHRSSNTKARRKKKERERKKRRSFIINSDDFSYKWRRVIISSERILRVRDLKKKAFSRFFFICGIAIIRRSTKRVEVRESQEVKVDWWFSNFIWRFPYHSGSLL